MSPERLVGLLEASLDETVSASRRGDGGALARARARYDLLEAAALAHPFGAGLRWEARLHPRDRVGRFKRALAAWRKLQADSRAGHHLRIRQEEDAHYGKPLHHAILPGVA